MRKINIVNIRSTFSHRKDFQINSIKMLMIAVIKANIYGVYTLIYQILTISDIGSIGIP